MDTSLVEYEQLQSPSNYRKTISELTPMNLGIGVLLIPFIMEQSSKNGVPIVIFFVVGFFALVFNLMTLKCFHEYSRIDLMNLVHYECGTWWELIFVIFQILISMGVNIIAVTTLF